MRHATSGMRCIALLWILTIGGCSAFRLAPTPPPVYTQTPYTPESYKADLDAYEALLKQATHDASDTTLAKRTALRNKIVYSTAKEIDKNYDDFKNSFFGERAATETALDVLQIGLSSAGTLAGGEATKEILAATATGVTGSRLSYNKNFFKEKTPDLLLSRMDALRAEQWSQLYRKLSSSTDEVYSLYETERDLVAYYQAGSLEAAFQNIIAESGAAQTKADREIKKQIERKYGAFLGELASEDEIKEVEELFNEFRAVKDPERDKRAKKIVDIFKGLMPDVPINPGAHTPSNLDNVNYLEGIAIDKEHPDIRRALTQAFKDAKSQ